MILRNCTILLLCSIVGVLLKFGAPPQRDCCLGDWWLKMSAAERRTYFLGYSTGYSEGFSHGCQRGTEHWPVTVEGYDNLPINRCMSDQRDFSKGPSFFVKAVDEFYSGHPEVRDVYPSEVLNLLGKGLTVDEIRKYPFMRHDGARSSQ